MLRIALVLGAMLALGGPAAAQAGWPNRPIHFIVPFTAGSSSDAVARIVAHGLEQRLGQSIVVENRVGAGGTIGAEAVAHAEPDGYMLGLANTSNLAVAPAFLPKMPYDPVRDLAPVAMIGNSPFVLQVFPGLPAKGIAELIALAKAEPGKLSYASAGTATLAHLAGALFAKLARVQLTHVPYRGSAQSVLDLVQGRIDMSFATIPPTLALVRDGKVRALAVTGLKRNPTMPDVPTLAESGVPGYDAVLWQAIVAPAKTPPAIITRLNKDIVSTLESPDMQRALMQQGIEPDPSTPEALGARIRADLQKWGDLVRSERLNGG